MEILILIIALFLMVIGFIGAVVPIIPGPLITYIGFLLLHFFTNFLDLSSSELIIYTLITIIVFSSDFILQFIGVKKFGGEKYSIYGTMIGIILGLFFTPIGLIIGPFLGAFIGALMDNKKHNEAFGIGFGALLGFIFGTFIKIVYSIVILIVTIDKIFPKLVELIQQLWKSICNLF